MEGGTHKGPDIEGAVSKSSQGKLEKAESSQRGKADLRLERMVRRWPGGKRGLRCSRQKDQSICRH